MVEACERRILEFPLEMDAREVAKELKREGWYAWGSDYASIIFRIERVRAKSARLITLMILPKPAILAELNGPITLRIGH